MSVWGMWKLEVILEIAVSMEGWAPAGLQQALASSPTPLCQASTRYLLLHGDPREGSEPWVGVLGQGRLGTVIIC